MLIDSFGINGQTFDEKNLTSMPSHTKSALQSRLRRSGKERG